MFCKLEQFGLFKNITYSDIRRPKANVRIKSVFEENLEGILEKYKNLLNGENCTWRLQRGLLAG
jgi:predicted component of viral defense system (DUF524 family)